MDKLSVHSRSRKIFSATTDMSAATDFDFLQMSGLAELTKSPVQWVLWTHSPG